MINYFFNKELYKSEYFEWRAIEKSEILVKKAGKYWDWYLILIDLNKGDCKVIKA